MAYLPAEAEAEIRRQLGADGIVWAEENGRLGVEGVLDLGALVNAIIEAHEYTKRTRFDEPQHARSSRLGRMTWRILNRGRPDKSDPLGQRGATLRVEWQDPNSERRQGIDIGVDEDWLHDFGGWSPERRDAWVEQEVRNRMAFYPDESRQRLRELERQARAAEMMARTEPQFVVDPTYLTDKDRDMALREHRLWKVQQAQTQRSAAVDAAKSNARSWDELKKAGIL